MESEEGDNLENCSSCGIRLIERGDSVFPCPHCGAAQVGRCRKCRDQSVSYKCPECGFMGP